MKAILVGGIRDGEEHDIDIPYPRLKTPEGDYIRDHVIVTHEGEAAYVYYEPDRLIEIDTSIAGDCTCWIDGVTSRCPEHGSDKRPA